MRKQTKRVYPLNECAEELGINKDLLRDYAMRGCPHDKGGKGKANRYDPDEVAAWMDENGLTGKPGRPADADSKDIEEAKLREINLRCRKHALDVAEREGELVPAAEVKQWIAEFVGGWKNRVLGLSAKLAQQMEGYDAAERHALLDQSHIELLNELSAAIAKLGVRAKDAHQA
jgi:hypothetical protein